jgi:hypothetical protein
MTDSITFTFFSSSSGLPFMRYIERTDISWPDGTFDFERATARVRPLCPSIFSAPAASLLEIHEEMAAMRTRLHVMQLDEAERDPAAPLH